MLEFLKQMYTSNPQDKVLHEYLAEREALPKAKEAILEARKALPFRQLTTLCDDSEEEEN